MQGGVIPFRGSGADARRYVEADRARADDYYLGAEATVAQFAQLDASGAVTAELALDPAAYAGWVDWTNPLTGEQMGMPRRAGSDRRGSPRFMEMVINTPKSLSSAAALHPEVSDALDAAQQDALSEIRRWLAQHSVTRVGSLGAQAVVPSEHMQVVGISHRTSRAGDPHRHIHMQIGTRVWAAGKWRGLNGAALFRQQGAIRALGTAVIAAHPDLAQTLAEHGLTLDPATGEVAELEPFNTLMSKRGEQVRKNLERLEAEWEAAHPGETIGPVVASRLRAQAWAYERPAKKPTTLAEEAAWVTELRDAGYDPDHLEHRAVQPPASLDDLSVQQVASRALDRCAASASAWTRHTVQEHVTRITTEAGVRAAPAQLREFIALATGLAVSDCFSVLPPGAAAPEHVAYLTSVGVVAAETALRDQLAAATPRREPKPADVTDAARTAGLDEGQTLAAAAVASTDPLVVVEGAAGAGKTTMLGVAIEVAAEQGRASRLVAPTLRAAQVAHDELGVPATSVAALVYAHGWRWNKDGVWTRLYRGDTDPETGRTYTGPPREARLSRGERVIVDEAGMLDQDTARALLTVTQEAGATVALVGDRAQLPAVGRGGVLDVAAQIRGRTYDMSELHRFTDPEYAALTLRMRDRANPGEVFDRLAAMRLVTLHADDDAAREHITDHAREREAITVATNDEAAALNERIRAGRIESGEVDDTVTATGSDGLSIGRGDLIQTRKNDTTLGVANRQQWIVQHVTDEGTVYARETGSGRKAPRTVTLPSEYVGEHAHLSYAATAYGVQGATVNDSHTMLSEATSAAGIYVGMTRGRQANRLHIVAEDMADARAQFIESMERDRADRGLDHATQAAQEAVRGLIADGPVRLVTEELARLDREAERAQRQAERWEQTAARLDAQRAAHRADDDKSTAALRKTEESAEQVRAEVTAPLTNQAEHDGAAYLSAVEDEAAISARLATVGRFGRRKARTEHRSATEHAQALRGQVSTEWGTTPTSTDRLPEWASRVAAKRAEADPRVTEAVQTVDAATADQEEMRERHEQERLALLVSEYGPERARRDHLGMRTTNPYRTARDARAKAALTRAEADELRSLPATDAAKRIEAKRAEQEHLRQQAAKRAQRLPDPFARDPHRGGSHREGPARGL
ncbi:MobF family relaxase [Brevibacterium luteolum]|uniref:TrwC relaxase n=1 Tax=Brevibacterium luteolum TaxID=199591 RepID=A0A6G8L052_9MICO|nr:MobF family relaxase [Brevibacterium luteolum]QIN30432.1 TrwC relaxase [Brevibacterium luteolum]